ncbi:hypothetical protein AGMMS50256_21880 [Betaproteobacteria bacterium]|nr:hypothetical protein AGMMS50256_21880 [Betaproteobacteria bacterium]
MAAALGITSFSPTYAAYVAWTLDLGVQGYASKREGVLGSLKARYGF